MEVTRWKVLSVKDGHPEQCYTTVLLVSLLQTFFLMVVWRLQMIPKNKWICMLSLFNFLPHTPAYHLYQFEHTNIPPAHVSIRFVRTSWLW